VSDNLPPGYSYDPLSFTHTPSAVINNPDGSTTLKWDISQIDGAVETGYIYPTGYSTEYIGYKLITPYLNPDIRVYLPRAYVDKNGNGADDAESEEPLLETYLVNRAPVAILDDITIFEGENATLDGTASYDPDAASGDSIVSYEWDTDGDGLTDATGPVILKKFGDNGIFPVSLKVTDSWGISSRDNANVIVENVAPSILVSGGSGVTSEGKVVAIAARVIDPGSDDLEFTWSWGYKPGCDDSMIIYNNGVSPDPTLSPEVNPVDITETESCQYGDNGLYTVTLTVSDDDGANTTGSFDFAVGNLDPEIGTITAEMELDLGIRVAGSKWSNVMLELVYEDGSSVQLLEVERWPGDPDKNPSVGMTSVTLDMTKSYKAVVTYDPYPDSGDAVEGDQGNNGKDKKNNAGNPVWLILQFADGTTIEIHHTFNTEQSKIKDSEHWNHVEPWEVDFIPYLIGHEIELTADASDKGSDDLTFNWSNGIQNVVQNSAWGPDPYPSPGGIYPFDADDSIAYIYNGPETITLEVLDDDAGSVLATFDIA
jgi:hypothetical protein